MIGKAAMAGTIVLDTSVLIKWIKSRDEELIREARYLLERIEKKSLQVVVPALLLYEIGNILLLKTRLDPEGLAVALDQVRALPFTVVGPEAELLRRTARLGRELNLTFYDASFVALAEQLDCTFVTADQKLHDRVRQLPRVQHLSALADV
ncbi:MAG: type II toxin-antitoxin system VapC family toxin [Thermoanaerobaculia bacterium]